MHFIVLSTYVWHLPNTSIVTLLLILIIIKLAFILRYMPATIIQIRGGMVGYYNFISVGAEHENLAKKRFLVLASLILWVPI